jgi:DNA-binding IclR family transcriptional regulator
MLKTKNVRNLPAKTTSPSSAQDKYFSRAVSKALEVLEMLQNEANAMSLNDVAKRTKLSKTSAFRLLRTLEVTGYAALDGRGQYKLAPGIHAVAPTQGLGKLIKAATPILHSVNEEFSETTSLAALFENRIEVVAVVESTHDLRMSNVVGHILPPNASSLGKVIIAFQTSPQRERLLRSFKIYRFTENTITDQKELSREYENIRTQQFAVDREECAPGGICFSVPIFGEGGQVSAAISLSMPKSRLRDPEHENEILATLRAAADQIAIEFSRS